jgi:PAS domain S-box-containing protein
MTRLTFRKTRPSSPGQSGCVLPEDQHDCRSFATRFPAATDALPTSRAGRVVGLKDNTAMTTNERVVGFTREADTPILTRKRSGLRHWERAVRFYVLAVGLAIAATALRWALDPLFGMGVPFVTYYPAVAIAALVGGARAGLLATVLSALGAHYFFMEPRGGLLPGPNDWVAVGLFSSGGVLVSWMAERVDRARRRDAAAAERNRAEEALRALSLELKRTLESSATGLTHCSRDLKYLSANPAYAKLVGVPLEDIVGRRIAEVMGPEAMEVIRPHVERVLKGERVVFEAEVPFASNGHKWLHVAYTPDEDATGAIVGWVASVTDITERKLSEEALRKKNERLHLLGEAAERLLSTQVPEVSVRELFERFAEQLGLDVCFNYLVDRSGTAMQLDSCLGVSEEVAQGIRRLEFGQAVCGVVAQERREIEVKDAQHCRDADTELIRSLGIQAYACFPLLAGERLLGTLSFGSRHRKEFGPEEMELLQTISCYVAVAQERARSRRTLEQSVEERTADLRQSEERMKLAANAGELGMWEWDLATGNMWLDERSLERIGPRNDKDSGYSRFLHRVHPEDRDGLAKAIVKAVSGDGNLEHVYRRVFPDGRIMWIASRGRVEFDAQHKPVKLRGVGMDVTARKLAEEQARESAREFLLIANSAPVLIWTSGPDKLCTFFNQPWLEFTGRTMDQELGNGWTEGVHPHDLSNCLKVYVESFDARQPFTMEYRLRRHDGQHRWLSDHGVPRYDSQGMFLGYIGSCVDVTERREAEARAQRSQQELAHVSRVSVLGELAGSLAHELNQPLTAIVTSGEAARRLMSGDRRNDEMVRDALKDVVEQGRRAGDIIVGMRTMLKKDPGQMEPQDVNRAVREILELVHSELVLRHVTLVTRLDPGLPRVRGHGVQLRQVLLNLVMNACEAMSEVPAERRELTVESRRVSGGSVEVSVKDAGPGFSEEMLQHAFEPFHTTKAKGLGLGLAICRSIIAVHGGNLVVANTGATGATLRFTLAVDSRDSA